MAVGYPVFGSCLDHGGVEWQVRHCVVKEYSSSLSNTAKGVISVPDILIIVTVIPSGSVGSVICIYYVTVKAMHV
jgi:hypothetical protein